LYISNHYVNPLRKAGSLTGAQPLTETYLPFREQGVLRGMQSLLVSKGKPSPLGEGRVREKQK
jgi:hypothetical protein